MLSHVQLYLRWAFGLHPQNPYEAQWQPLFTLRTDKLFSREITLDTPVSQPEISMSRASELRAPSTEAALGVRTGRSVGELGVR